MNAVAIIEPTQEPTLSSWIERGRSLATERRDVDWRLGDWLHDGQQQGYLDQAGFDFLSENLGIAPKRLRDINRAVEAFPAHLRDRALSVEHHASVAALPQQDALDLLHKAKAEHWTPERTRVEAQTHRGEESGVRGDRDSDGMLESFLRHWNRLPRALRLDAAELIAAAKGEEIEP
jgi:hypothetical protein